MLKDLHQYLCNVHRGIPYAPAEMTTSEVVLPVTWLAYLQVRTTVQNQIKGKAHNCLQPSSICTWFQMEKPKSFVEMINIANHIF